MRQFPSHPSPNSAAIVRYLDYVNRRIRRYVTAKRKLIALLEEEKQAVVNQVPSPAASTPTSASSPPASSGSAMCRRIGRCREAESRL